MKQMDVSPENKVEIDFEDEKWSNAVRTLRPLVYKEEAQYCCVLGPDRDEGVYGSGDNLEDALNDWETALRKRIMYHRPGDEVALFIEDNLNASKKEIN